MNTMPNVGDVVANKRIPTMIGSVMRISEIDGTMLVRIPPLPPSLDYETSWVYADPMYWRVVSDEKYLENYAIDDSFDESWR